MVQRSMIGAGLAAAAKSQTLVKGNTVLLLFYVVTSFLSALLLFWVEPMFAKMALPALGGSPSVWAVALFFFQAALLAGYCYAHVLNHYVKPQVAGWLHLAFTATAFLALPIGLPANWSEPPAGEPYLWQLGLFAIAVGLPFMALAANAPLLQAWFARTGHKQAADPYFLYAASNLGSLIALIAYPFAIEPLMGLKLQSRLWMWLFLLLAGLIAASFMKMLLGGGLQRQPVAHVGLEGASTAPTYMDRARWVGLALIPSALLTAFTTHVATDIASAPLIWVIPLALYLLTFVLVFRPWPRLPTAFVRAALCLAFSGLVLVVLSLLGKGDALISSLGAQLGDWWAAVAALLAVGAIVLYPFSKRVLGEVRTPLSTLVGSLQLIAVLAALLSLAQTNHTDWQFLSPIGVAAFFATALVAHRTLYENRPSARYLTEFYLWLSFGGVLGGLFAGLIAPKLFSEVLEYPLLLALSLACRPGALALVKDEKERHWLAGIGIAGLIALFLLRDYYSGYLKLGENLALALVLAFAATILIDWKRPDRRLLTGLLAFLAVAILPSHVHRGDAERSYFGVYRVYPSSDGDFRLLTHGTTLHGAERIKDKDGQPSTDSRPATYYYADGPMAKAVEIVKERERPAGAAPLGFGVVGLGTGSLACLSAKGETWKYFEIDPTVIAMSGNREGAKFTFVKRCKPDLDIKIGDARLTLARENDESLDLLIVDAFSSDAIPMHLMTAEALQLYMQKLSFDGILVLHISNRYLDLESVVSSTVAKVPGLSGLIIEDEVEGEEGYDALSSTVAIIAKTDAALEPFRDIAQSRPLSPGKVHAWTDDFSDILTPFLRQMKLAD